MTQTVPAGAPASVADASSRISRSLASEANRLAASTSGYRRKASYVKAGIQPCSQGWAVPPYRRRARPTSRSHRHLRREDGPTQLILVRHGQTDSNIASLLDTAH